MEEKRTGLFKNEFTLSHDEITAEAADKEAK